MPTFVRPVYDIEVSEHGNYISSGIINSNSGKTYCMCAQMLFYLKTYPGIKVVVASAFDGFISEFILPTWRRVLDDDDPFIASKNVKERTYKMINGSEIRFHAYLDPENIRGWEAHIIWIDEAAQIGYGNNDVGFAIWTAFTQRLRAEPKEYPCMMYVTQNPSGHNWVWKVFVKPDFTAPQPHGDIGIITEYGVDSKGHKLKYHEWEKTNTEGDTYYSIVTSSYANKHLRSGYIESMLGTMVDQPGEKERMIEGMWTPINSLVYDWPTYSVHTHCVDYQRFLDFHEWDEMPSWNRVVVGIDCGGQRSPWAVEYYMYIESEYTFPHWVCFEEIYQIGKDWDEIAGLIKEKEREYGFESVQYFIDPQSSRHAVGPTQTTVQKEFAARGISTTIAPGYNKAGGRARVRTMLARDRTIPCPYIDDDQIEEDGKMVWTCGHAKLYYLKGVPGKPREVFRDGKKLIVNEEGHAAPGNIHEKTVYRFEAEKIRAPKQSEEGLSVALSEKVMDRDDHAQTSEMFFALGIAPMIKKERSKRQNREELNEVNGMYGRTGKYRR